VGNRRCWYLSIIGRNPDSQILPLYLTRSLAVRRNPCSRRSLSCSSSCGRCGCLARGYQRTCSRCVYSSRISHGGSCSSVERLRKHRRRARNRRGRDYIVWYDLGVNCKYINVEYSTPRSCHMLSKSATIVLLITEMWTISALQLMRIFSQEQMLAELSITLLNKSATRGIYSKPSQA
jgi:hypothetical protein